MDAPNSSRRHAHLALAAVLFATAASCGLLYRFPPSQYGFYPVCPIHQYTGWLCPGCGMTRSLAALTHGNLREAVHWNPLIVIVIPGLIAWLTIACRERRLPKFSNLQLGVTLLALATFTIARNLAHSL